MQVIGLCRFSYPAIGGFQVDFPTIEERIAYLYAPERMKERFATFETFTLPSLRAQTDQDFTFAVVIGDQLPQPYLERLQTLLADLPQAVILPLAPKQHRPAMRKAINSVRRFDETPCLQFRMDDDDAVAVSFIAKLRQKARALRPLLRDHKTVAIDFNQGYILRPSPEGLWGKSVQSRYQTAALGMMLRHDARTTIMNFSHHKISNQSTTATFTGDDMFIRGHNAHNDSRQSGPIKRPELTLLTAQEEARMKATFNIDASRIREAFADA